MRGSHLTVIGLTDSCEVMLAKKVLYLPSCSVKVSNLLEPIPRGLLRLLHSWQVVATPHSGGGRASPGRGASVATARGGRCFGMGATFWRRCGGVGAEEGQRGGDEVPAWGGQHWASVGVG